MDLEGIRKKSLETARKLGYLMSASLPLLDEDIQVRKKEDVIARALTLNCILACSFGFPRNKAINWLVREGLRESLTLHEQTFLENGQVNSGFSLQVEGLWVLAWSLGFVHTLDFSSYCGNELVGFFPNLKEEESSSNFHNKSILRPAEDIIAACDLAYCLHWATKEMEIRGEKPRGKVKPYVIMERRRALEWLLSDYDWDGVPLDT